MAPEVLLTLAIFFAVGGYALLRGGSPEKFAAKIVVLWLCTDVGYHLLFGPSGFIVVDPAHLVIDGAELAAITWLALRANRVWPIWAAAAQVMTFMGHIAALLDPGGMSQAYWAMTQLPPYIQLIALGCGIAFHDRRFRRIGNYRSWRTT